MPFPADKQGIVYRQAQERGGVGQIEIFLAAGSNQQTGSVATEPPGADETALQNK